VGGKHVIELLYDLLLPLIKGGFDKFACIDQLDTHIPTSAKESAS